MSDDEDDESAGSSSNPIGTHRGYRVFVGYHSDPADAPAPDEFGVNLFIPNPHGENVDIARIDTAHNGCHVDHLYREDDDPLYREDYSVTVHSPEEAIIFFLGNERWKEYVDKYEKNHGLPEHATEHGQDDTHRDG